MTVANDDREALVFDTYERAVELAELAASIRFSDPPFGLVGVTTPDLHAACRKFMKIVENTALC